MASAIVGNCRLIFAADAVLVFSLGMFLFDVTLQNGFEHQNRTMDNSGTGEGWVLGLDDSVNGG